MPAASLEKTSTTSIEQPAKPSPEQPPRSLRKNFSWALLGNLIYQGSQWLSLVIVAKLLTPLEVGQYALALAISTPIATFTSLSLRSIQVTDIQNEHRFGDFLSVQLIGSICALASIVGIVCISRYDFHTSALIIAVGIGQILFGIRDIFLGYHQKIERMDTITTSNALVSATSLLAMASVVWGTKDLLLGIVAVQIVRIICFFSWDLLATSRLVSENTSEVPQGYLRPIWDAHTIRNLIWQALPLGITFIVFSLYSNVPRYFIAASLGDEKLGYFAAVMAMVTSGVLITQAASTTALPRLSRYYGTDRHAFFVLLGKLVGAGIGLGLVGLAVVLAIGDVLLAILFTPAYAAYYDLFIWSMVYGSLTYAVTFLGLGLTAMRLFRLQPLPYIIGLLSSATACWILIPVNGLLGAAIALIIGKICQALVTAVIIAAATSK